MRTKTANLRNVTLSAKSDLIDEARKVASSRGITLNDAFRAWLESFARHTETQPHPYETFVSGLGDKKLGPMPSRKERNQRSA